MFVCEEEICEITIGLLVGWSVSVFCCPSWYYFFVRVRAVGCGSDTVVAVRVALHVTQTSALTEAQGVSPALGVWLIRGILLSARIYLTAPYWHTLQHPQPTSHERTRFLSSFLPYTFFRKSGHFGTLRVQPSRQCGQAARSCLQDDHHRHPHHSDDATAGCWLPRPDVFCPEVPA